jgi:hypothetical protein
VALPVASDTLYLFLVRAVGDELDMPQRRVKFPKAVDAGKRDGTASGTLQALHIM